jgi:hypothetical protein
MTLKTTMMGALLAASLFGLVGQAKADALRVNVAPPRVHYVQPGWRREWVRFRRPYWRAVAVPVPAPVAVPSYGYGYAGADAQDPWVVAAQIRAEMDRAAEDVRFDVRQGVVEPRALASLDGDRQEIERDLAEASAKGYITAEDRAHLEQHVQEIRDLRDQLRCAREAPAAYTYGR